MKKAQLLINIFFKILLLGLIILGFYLQIKGNYLGSICIWVQLIYIKIFEKL